MLAEATLRSTATHEAGHAAATWYLGWPFNSVSIVPDADSSGHIISPFYENAVSAVATAGSAAPAIWRVAVSTTIRLQAGFAAAAMTDRGLSDEWLYQLGHAGGSDLPRCLAISRKLLSWDPGRMRTFTKTTSAWTAEVVRTTWPAIRALAAELERRRTVTGSAAEGVMDRAQPGLGKAALRNPRWLARLDTVPSWAV